MLWVYSENDRNYGPGAVQSYHRAFIRAGYRDEGTRRAHYMLNGRMTDVHLLGLIPEDLAS